MNEDRVESHEPSGLAKNQALYIRTIQGLCPLCDSYLQRGLLINLLRIILRMGSLGNQGDVVRWGREDWHMARLYEEFECGLGTTMGKPSKSYQTPRF